MRGSELFSLLSQREMFSDSVDKTSRAKLDRHAQCRKDLQGKVRQHAQCGQD